MRFHAGLAFLPVGLALLAPSSAHAETLAGRTHSFVLPTGELVPDGKTQFSLHDFLLADYAVGVNDRLEISVTAPLIPAIVQFHARTQLLPRHSPGRLVVGAGTIATVNGGFFALEASATAAVQVDSFNLHVTASAMRVDEHDAKVGFLGAGVLVAASDRLALFADVGRLTSVHEDCDSNGCSTEFEAIQGFMLGAKLLGESTDVDLGFLKRFDGSDEDMPVLPFLSLCYHGKK